AVTLTAANISNGFLDITPSALGAGSHSFNATVTDKAGNPSAASGNFTVTIDTTAPATTIATIKDMALPQNGNSIVLTGTSDADTQVVKVFDAGTLLGSATLLSNGAWNFSYVPAKSNIAHTFTAQATDAAGNIGPSSGPAFYGTNQVDTLVGTAGNDLIFGR